MTKEKIEQKSIEEKSTTFISIPLVLSVLAVAVSVTTPLWQNIIYPSSIVPVVDYKRSIDNNTHNIETLNSALSTIDTSLVINATDLNIKLETQTNNIQKLSTALEDFKYSTENRLLGLDTQKILMNNMATIAFSGEPYEILSSAYQLSVEHRKNKSVRDAYAVIKKNSSGIKTMNDLRNSLRENGRELNANMAEQDATTFFEKLKSRILNLVYVSKIGDTRKELVPEKLTGTEKIINLLDNNKLQEAIIFSRTYDNKFLRIWAKNAQNRFETLNAFAILLGGK